MPVNLRRERLVNYNPKRSVFPEEIGGHLIIGTDHPMCFDKSIAFLVPKLCLMALRNSFDHGAADSSRLSLEKLLAHGWDGCCSGSDTLVLEDHIALEEKHNSVSVQETDAAANAWHVIPRTSKRVIIAVVWAECTAYCPNVLFHVRLTGMRPLCGR